AEFQAGLHGCTGTSCAVSALEGSLSAGKHFSCAVMPDSRIRCWGHNDSGKLGSNLSDASNYSIPKVLKTKFTPAGSAIDVYGALAVSSGYDHACARMQDTRVLCWGNNAYGQGGNGSTASPHHRDTTGQRRNCAR